MDSFLGRKRHCDCRAAAGSASRGRRATPLAQPLAVAPAGGGQAQFAGRAPTPRALQGIRLPDFRGRHVAKSASRPSREWLRNSTLGGGLRGEALRARGGCWSCCDAVVQAVVEPAEACRRIAMDRRLSLDTLSHVATMSAPQGSFSSGLKTAIGRMPRSEYGARLYAAEFHQSLDGSGTAGLTSRPDRAAASGASTGGSCCWGGEGTSLAAP